METLNTVTKSGNTPSSPAPKAIATVVRPSLMQPDDKERAGLSVSTTVSSDGLYRFIERTAYRVTPFRREPNPLPGAGSDFCRPVPRTPSIMHRLFAGGLVTSGENDMPRPLPLLGNLETKVLDFAVWRRRAMADGRIDQHEAMEGIQIASSMAAVSGSVIESVQFATRVLTGAEGMDSTCVRRQWDQRQKDLVILDDYRMQIGPDAA